MVIRSLPVLALLLVLGACHLDDPSSASEASSESSPPRTVAGVADTSMIRAVSPEQTLGLLAGGVAAASPSHAIQTIDQWVARIDSAAAQVEGEREALAGLSDDLTHLRHLLQSSPLDGQAIGRALSEVSEGTAALVPSGTPLARLAEVLGAQGRRLAPPPPPGDSTETAAREDS